MITSLPRHITRKRAWDLEQLRRKGYDIRPHTKSSPCEALKVSGGDYLRLGYPPLDRFGRVSSRWGGQDEDVSNFSPGPLDRVGVHVPKIESTSYANMMQSLRNTKSVQNQEKKRKIFAKILAKAVHRESQRTRRLQQCRTDAERRNLNRKYRKERLKCENELKKLLRKTEVFPTDSLEKKKKKTRREVEDTKENTTTTGEESDKLANETEKIPMTPADTKEGDGEDK